MNFDDIKARTGAASPLPFTLVDHDDAINGVESPPQCIISPRRTLAGLDEGLVYGLSPDTADEVRADAEFLRDSKLMILSLMDALEHAAGFDSNRCNFLVEHAHKEVLQRHGLLPTEKILKVKPAK